MPAPRPRRQNYIDIFYIDWFRVWFIDELAVVCVTVSPVWRRDPRPAEARLSFLAIARSRGQRLRR
jgi:hypothetical protein